MKSGYRRFLQKAIAMLLFGLIITNVFLNSLTVNTYADTMEDSGIAVHTASNSREQSFWSSTLPDVNYGEQIMSLSGLTNKERQDAKAVYDALTTITTETKTMSIPFVNGCTFTSATDSPTEEEIKPAVDYVQKVTQTAIDAFLRDYPEVFWIEVEESEWVFTFLYQKTGGYYTNKVTKLEYAIVVKDEYSDPAIYDAKLQEAIVKFPVTGATRYEKLKSIHDELCRRNVYVEGLYSHQAYGALVDGKSVCEGYGKAFKLICDRENIPCVLVTGTSLNYNGTPEFHLWNYVKMEDGKWYAVDVTWDDGDSTIYYDYFLVGSNSKAPNFRNDTFMGSHEEDGDFNLTGYVEFTYPTISEVAYDKDSAVVPTPTPDPTPTPEPKPVRPLPGDEYLYGDADLNGVVEAPDALLILKAVVKLTTFDETVQIISDVDNDWQVGANDALYVLRKVVRLIDLFPVEEAIINEDVAL